MVRLCGWAIFGVKVKSVNLVFSCAKNILYKLKVVIWLELIDLSIEHVELWNAELEAQVLDVGIFVLLGAPVSVLTALI